MLLKRNACKPQQKTARNFYENSLMKSNNVNSCDVKLFIELKKRRDNKKSAIADLASQNIGAGYFSD